MPYKVKRIIQIEDHVSKIKIKGFTIFIPAVAENTNR